MIQYYMNYIIWLHQKGKVSCRPSRVSRKMVLISKHFGMGIPPQNDDIGQNLVRLGNGEDSANNQVHQIYLLDSFCWKSHHCCLTNCGFLSYHVLSEGVLLSEILSEPLSNGWLPEVSYQRLELVSSTCCAKRRGSLGLDREWRDWVTGSQREKNAKLVGTFSPQNFVAI